MCFRVLSLSRLRGFLSPIAWVDNADRDTDGADVPLTLSDRPDTVAA